MTMYQLFPINSVIRLDDGMIIPFDPTNTDYQQYLLWLEEGNEPLPADPIPEPEPLTPEQKLQNAGLSIEELKLLLGLPVDKKTN